MVLVALGHILPFLSTWCPACRQEQPYFFQEPPQLVPSQAGCLQKEAEIDFFQNILLASSSLSFHELSPLTLLPSSEFLCVVGRLF